MIFKNLFRCKGRTILTLVGIAIGVAAIVALGAMAQGIRAGFGAMSRGSQADLVVTQCGSMSAVMSSVDETVADELRTLPEVADVDGMLFGNAMIEGTDYLFIFGYDPDGFAIEHFRIVEGQGLADARGVRGKPLIMGQRAAQSKTGSAGGEPGNCWSWWAWETACDICPVPSLVVSASGFPSPGRWPISPRWFWPMSLLATWTPRAGQR